MARLRTIYDTLYKSAHHHRHLGIGLGLGRAGLGLGLGLVAAGLDYSTGDVCTLAK